MPFGKVTLRNRTTATQDKPSSVFSADICSSTVCRLNLCALSFEFWTDGIAADRAAMFAAVEREVSSHA